MRKDILELWLPYPPTINHYYGQKGKMRFITEKGQQFRRDVMQAVKNAGAPSFGNQSLRIEWYPYLPDRRKRDFDNILKPLLDALQHANVIDNDSQFKRWAGGSIEKSVHKGDGAVNVIISPIEDIELNS